MRRTARTAAAAALVAALFIPVPGRATSHQPAIVVGAAKENITPFTAGHPGALAVDPLSNPAASNPDGLPGGPWDTFAPEGFGSPVAQVTVSGLWGEPFTDENGNRRWDEGEPFADDPVNSRLDPDSAGTWDGIFLAGFGENRVPRGVFDPIWARAVYYRDPATGLAFAHVSIDVLGWFSDWNDRIVGLAREIDPQLDLDHLVVSHTHTHEGPDTHVGLWGTDVVHDGTYPKYERYVEVKIAQAVVAAAQGAGPAHFKFGSIRPGEPFVTSLGNTEDLAGMQSRNSCRTPWVFDDEVRVVQIVEAPAPGQPAEPQVTIATIVNWGTHPESLEGDNVYLSSDYPHSLRETVEDALGGMAMFVPGALGAGEIVGDSCTLRWQRTMFDGDAFPVDDGGEPLVLKNIGTDPLGAYARTAAIGRVVGAAAVAAVADAPIDSTATGIGGFTKRDIFVPANNGGLAALAAIGVIDKPTYLGGVSVGSETAGRLGMSASPVTGVDVKTSVYAWRLGSASFATAPGELFPEIYYGVAAHHRGVNGSGLSHFDWPNPNPAALDCAARPFSYGDPRGAHTGRPFEPGIREAQVARFGTAHNFVFGNTVDLFGYIVPGYDYSWFGTPLAQGVGLGAVHGIWGADQAADPCGAFPPDLGFEAATYTSHYQETNSAGSMLAPAYACTVWAMLGLDPANSTAGSAACVEWEAWKAGGVVHVGVEPVPCDPFSNTDCVRHY